MSTIQSQLVCDSSTLTNFKAWAQAISTAFSTFGWTQSSDSGQVNWTSIAAVPGAASYVYEIWQPNDGLTTFYVKVEYGNVSGTNCPSLRLTLSTTTNGSGTASGFVVGPINTNATSFTAPSTTTQYECNFSGAAGRIGVMMWRNGTNNCQQLFAVERSLNSSGAYTSDYVTLWTIGLGASTVRGSFQASIVFGQGATPSITNSNSQGGWNVRMPNIGSSLAFQNSYPLDLAAPLIGSHAIPCTMIGALPQADTVEGVAFPATVFGSTRTYIPSKNGFFTQGNPVQSNAATSLAMRYD